MAGAEQRLRGRYGAVCDDHKTSALCYPNEGVKHIEQQ